MEVDLALHVFQGQINRARPLPTSQVGEQLVDGRVFGSDVVRIVPAGPVHTEVSCTLHRYFMLRLNKFTIGYYTVSFSLQLWQKKTDKEHQH